MATNNNNLPSVGFNWNKIAENLQGQNSNALPNINRETKKVTPQGNVNKIFGYPGSDEVSQTVVTPEPTVADVYKTYNPTTTDFTGVQKEKDFLNSYNLSDSEEEKIRNATLDQFQEEINAANNAYASLLKEQQQQGLGRLGENTAIQARRGMLGSDFGSALTEGNRALNQKNEQSVMESQATAIASIMARAQEAARGAISDKRAAKQGGYTAYQNYLSTATDKRDKSLSALAQDLLLNSLSPNDLDPNALSTMAKQYGVTTQDIINSYLKEKKVQDEKAVADSFNLSEGQRRYDATGKEIAYNPQTYAPKSSGTGGLTPYQQFTATQSIAKDNQKRTEGAREMARQAQLIDQSYNNILNGGDRSLNTQAIVTSFNKILDPSSVVRESEYDRTAEGQSLLAQLEGKIQQIATGGAGITDATIKEASEIAKTYLENSKASIKAENDRAVQMADAFGLNSQFVSNTYQDNTQSDTTLSPDDEALLNSYGI